MIRIRPYQEADAKTVGQLIANTYSDFNLSYLPIEERGPYLGPFRHSGSEDAGHREEIAQTIQADIVLVAEEDGKIAGALRGKKGRLQSLFVLGECHGQGIGRQLVRRFEDICLKLGSKQVTLASSLFAVPFYQRMGYKKSTGVREGKSFHGAGLRFQPMKKILD